jgi:hypothetical protein
MPCRPERRVGRVIRGCSTVECRGRDDEQAEYQRHDGPVVQDDRVEHLSVPADEHRDLMIDLGKALPGEREVVLRWSDERETQPFSGQRSETIVDGRVVGQHAGEENAARGDHHDGSQDELNSSSGGLDVHR